MMRLTRHAGLPVALSLLTSAATANAGGAWLLWSKVYIMKDGEIADHFYSAEAFTSKPECEKAARHYEENCKAEGTRAYFIGADLNSAHGRDSMPHDRDRRGRHLHFLENDRTDGSFAYLTAWRRGEVGTLRWSDVDRAGAVIRLRPERSKNGRGRTVAIEGDLGAIIERRAQARIVSGRDGEPERIAELVFHRGGKPVGDFRKAWAAACIEAGLSRVVGTNADGTERRKPTRLFHDLRRSGVRNIMRAGVRERVAMDVSGHRTRSIFDRYNITSEDDLRDAMKRTTEYVNAQPTQSNVTRLRPAVAAR